MITHEELTIQQKIALHPPGMEYRPTFPRDGADPDCRICGGFGWKVNVKYNGHWFPCPCTVGARDKFLNDRRPKFDPSTIGLQEGELGMSWDLVLPKVSDGMKAVEAVRPAYQRGYGMVFLWGTWGQAKTLVGKILTATGYRDGKRAAYANMAAVLANVRAAFDEQRNQNAELSHRINWWIQRDVLFIDELDKVNATPWAAQTMFDLLDQRYVRAIREDALTVIASNSESGELDGYLRSRLGDKRLGPIVHLDGPDGRKVMPEGYHF